MVNSLARYIRIVEVRGSNPLSSITHPRRLKMLSRGFFLRQIIYSAGEICVTQPKGSCKYVKMQKTTQLL